jgi:hypothetical protein
LHRDRRFGPKLELELLTADEDHSWGLHLVYSLSFTSCTTRTF